VAHVSVDSRVCGVMGPLLWGSYLGPAPSTVRHTAGALTFTRYCNDQYCMVYGLVKGGVGKESIIAQ